MNIAEAQQTALLIRYAGGLPPAPGQQYPTGDQACDAALWLAPQIMKVLQGGPSIHEIENGQWAEPRAAAEQLYLIHQLDYGRDEAGFLCARCKHCSTSSTSHPLRLDPGFRRLGWLADIAEEHMKECADAPAPIPRGRFAEPVLSTPTPVSGGGRQGGGADGQD